MNGKIKILISVMAAMALLMGAAAVFYYTTQSYLVLSGEENVTIGLYGVYEDAGVKAKHNGKNALDDVVVTGDVDTSVPGIYTLKYALGTMSVTRTVTVLEEMNPAIFLEELDEAENTFKLGDEFREPGYSASDEYGNDITDRVQVTGTDINKAGENIIEYTVSDDNGNTTCVSRSVNVEANTDYDTAGIAICMYHYVYDEEDPPEDLNKRYGNYISTEALEEELKWLNDEGYYYPTWEEVRAYINGELILPEKSVVLTFDDGAVSFLEKGIPLLEKYQVPATCFMITSKNGEEKIAKYSSEYVTYESHSDNMHRAGGYVGHGGIFTAISYDDGMADLEKSIEICGSGDAFAYPYGDYNDSSKAMVEDAGFLCAVTTEYGRARPGNDPLLLPRMRMYNGQSLAAFIAMVSP